MEIKRRFVLMKRRFIFVKRRSVQGGSKHDFFLLFFCRSKRAKYQSKFKR